MHLHILGICGTFMGGVAQLARALGHEVSGSDANVYPPMSSQLEAAGIGLMEGYEPDHLEPAPDQVVVGNALSRGNPAVEYMLDRGLRYTSGPQWLAENLLQERWVLAVAGTHGKTTTASMLAWILEHAGLAPGFLIGGVPRDFGVSARLGEAPFFVVEADEYDTAFFDKRSKFVHYRARTLVLNNLEMDHADIFDDLAQIQRQFHHLVRTVPGNGLIIAPTRQPALDEVLEIERASYPYPWTRTIFMDCLHAGYSCWVCGRRGLIEGYGVLSVAAGESHLLNICMRKESRGRGLGSKMLTHLTAIARRHNAEVIFLEVRVSNRLARKLYEFSGFNELGTRRDYYPTNGGREDALILARTL